MDIVLGVSLTPKTVRMVLVEGEKADGAIVDHDTFDVMADDGSATRARPISWSRPCSAPRRAPARAATISRRIGVTWTDHAEAAALRDALAARGINDVMLVSELHAAGALAQAAGRAVGYESTGLLFVDRDTATLSVVRSDDGSIVKVLSRSLHSTDAMAVLAEMVAAVEAQDSPPQGMFVVGSGVDVASVKEHLTDLVVDAGQRARGVRDWHWPAAPRWPRPTPRPSTRPPSGLAYSQDPDGATAGNDVPGARPAPPRRFGCLRRRSTPTTSTPIDRRRRRRPRRDASRSCSSAAR